MNAIKNYVEYYTIIFKDNYELDIPKETYEAIKQRIEQKIYEIEIGWSLYNMHYTNYKRIERKQRQHDEVEDFIMKINDKWLKEYIISIKKQRQQDFPYKRPFTSIEQIQTFIQEYKKQQWNI